MSQAAELIAVEDIPLADIDVGQRIRPVSETALESLLASIRETGHMADEIHVRKVPGGQHVLIAGGHRLEAAKRLEWPTIRAKVWKCSGQWARLWELDDNLAHAELDTLELATFLASRKALFHKMHPESAGGKAGAAARWEDATDIVSFASTIAEKRGISERHVRRLTSAGEALTPDQKRRLRDAPKAPTLADLTALAKEGDEAARSHAITAFSNGDAKSVKAALAARQNKPVKNPVQTAHEGLLNAFRRAPMAAKRAFVRDYADDLAQLLADLQDGGGDE